MHMAYSSFLRLSFLFFIYIFLALFYASTSSANDFFVIKKINQQDIKNPQEQPSAEHFNTITGLINLTNIYQHTTEVKGKNKKTIYLNITNNLSYYIGLIKKQYFPKTISSLFGKILGETIGRITSSPVKKIKPPRIHSANPKISPKISKFLMLADNEQYLHRVLAGSLINIGLFAESEQVLDILDEKEKYDYLKGTRGNTLPSIDITFINQPWYQRYSEIENQLINLSREFQALKKKGYDHRTETEDQRYWQLHDDLKKADDAFFAILKQINAELSTETKSELVGEGWVQYKKEEMDKITTNKARRHLQTIQQHSSKKVVHVRYIVLEKELKILLSTADSSFVVRSVPITQSLLREKVMDYRDALTEKQPLRVAAKELYHYLIKPIEHDLQQAEAEVLLLSPQDVLHHLPFAALHNGHDYLIQRYLLSRHTVGTLNLSGRKKRYHIAAMGVSKEAKIENNEQQFYPLTYVPQELDHIVKEKRANDKNGVLSGSIWLNEKFDQQRLISVLEQDHFNIVHLATHFHLNAGDASQSFLLLGNNKVLSVAEIIDSNYILDFNNTAMLVLSACKTAIASKKARELKDMMYSAGILDRVNEIIGRDRSDGDGKELKSFAAVAQDNGAESVVASLWAVDDESTSRLMQNLYRYWQHDKLGRLAALQKVQQDFITQQTTTDCPAVQIGEQPTCDNLVNYANKSHPYYWAPFILMGNWL